MGNVGSRLRTLAVWAAIVAVGSIGSGCASLDNRAEQPHTNARLPSQREVRVPPYLFITDVDLPRTHPLLRDLEGLQEQVCRELELPPINDVVKVYLFADRESYDRYMKAHFEELPPRRAFFMATSDERRGDELIVYTYWGDRVQEDLRHELTHALLHGVLQDVPMWLDEGLAEYFEVPANWKGINYRHLSRLGNKPNDVWTPDLTKLEQLTMVSDMKPADYRESWAWVHFLLSNPQTKTALLEYLKELRTSKTPGPLEDRLKKVLPDLNDRLSQHVARIKDESKSLGVMQVKYAE